MRAAAAAAWRWESARTRNSPMHQQLRPMHHVGEPAHSQGTGSCRQVAWQPSLLAVSTRCSAFGHIQQPRRCPAAPSRACSAPSVRKSVAHHTGPLAAGGGRVVSGASDGGPLRVERAHGAALRRARVGGSDKLAAGRLQSWQLQLWRRGAR
jgi:hypothetical protein